MRIARFANELEQMLMVGRSLNMAVKGAWRRSHPDAARRTKDWIDRICAHSGDDKLGASEGWGYPDLPTAPQSCMMKPMGDDK